MSSKKYWPAAWAPSKALKELEGGRNNSPCILTDEKTKSNDIPLYRDPEGAIAALEQEVQQLREFARILRSRLGGALWTFDDDDDNKALAMQIDQVLRKESK